MLTNYISIQLNGQPFNCKKNLSLKDLLLYLNININATLIEYNREVVQDTSFDKIILQRGDKVEILTIVGGG